MRVDRLQCLVTPDNAARGKTPNPYTALNSTSTCTSTSTSTCTSSFTCTAWLIQLAALHLWNRVDAWYCRPD